MRKIREAFTQVTLFAGLVSLIFVLAPLECPTLAKSSDPGRDAPLAMKVVGHGRP